MTGAQILRDYLYLDIDKVKSIAGQLEYGVPEETRLTSRSTRRSSVGWNAVLSFAPESGEENYVNRSTLDSLFPDLEEALESDGWLVDISDLLDPDLPDSFTAIKTTRPEASIFRATAEGYLFDSRYLAGILAGFSSSVAGWSELGRAVEEQQSTTTSRNKPGKGRDNSRSGTTRSVASSTTGAALEDQVEEFPEDLVGLTPNFLRSLVRMSRGLYKPGLNLILLNSADAGAVSISARLQENRRYLDADPETIGSRFGMRPQSWTIVGTIGHYSAGTEQADIASMATSMSRGGQGLDRNAFVRAINSVIQNMGVVGMIDLPQHPGLSAIPIAVYRSVLRSPSTAIEATGV